MVQVDLITGFLGSGKTTFMRHYARYMVQQGWNVCILENDFGAVNVDVMLLQDILGDHCDMESISGGCDCDTHQRRMRTKLISLAMQGFDRVIIEPSGIFDVDEFFDILHDEPLDKWYRMGNVIAVVDAKQEQQLSPQSAYLLASETANAGMVVLSRSQLAKPGQCEAAVAHLKRALTACKCSRVFQPEEILAKDWAALTEADMARIARCGMRQASCEKLHFEEHEAFSSAYFLELGLPRARLERNIPSLFTDPACGRVLRVKGFVEEAGQWVELNADGTFPIINATREGVSPVGTLNPYERVEAETIAFSEGVKSEPNVKTGIYISEIHNGDYIKVREVDFGNKSPKRFTATVASALRGGTLEVRTDSISGPLIAELTIPSTGGWECWKTLQTDIVKPVTGIQDIYFVFKGRKGCKLFNFDWYKFNR